MPGKVLVADDTELNRTILAAILHKAGLPFVLAKDGDEALALARAEVPDLILLDVMMPGKDGYQVLEELRREPVLSSVPVIFLTARDAIADKVRGFELGAADYVTKPMDVEEVLARVRAQLRLRELSLSLARANDELRARQALLERDLRAAADIQRALLPRGRLDLPHLSAASLFLPAHTVGGDLFHVQRLDEGTAAAWVLDVSGHGVPSAMVTVSVAQSLSLQGGIVAGDLRHGPPLVAEPRQVLAQLDADYPLERFDRYFTIAYLLVELQTGILRASRAGHPPALLLRRGAPLRELEAGGTIIGLGGAEFEQEQLALEDGDRVFLYTDGVVDYASPSGEPFGDGRLREMLGRTLDLPLSRAVEELLAALRAHGNEAPPRDDVTLLGLEWRKPLLLEVDSTLLAVRSAAARLRAHWRAAGVPEAAAQSLELAFVEAATNVVVHGHRGEAGHPLLVQSATTEARVELVLRDTGTAVPGKFAEPLRDPATLAEGGRGTFLIRTTMDSVQYTSGPEGNVLVLRKGTLSSKS